MNRHRRTWAAIYATPVRSNIPWKDIESLLVYLGAEIEEGRGSRISVILCGIPHTFHRPHPEKETDKGAVIDVKDFLDQSGVDKP